MRQIVKFLIILLILMVTFLMTACGGNSGINKAIENGDLEAVRARLEKDPAALNMFDEEGYTLVHRAAQMGQKEILGFLLEKGAALEVKTRDVNGFRPLHLAVNRGNKACVEMLMARDVDVNAVARVRVGGPNFQRWTPLCFAVWKGHEDVVKVLIAGGAELNPAAPVTIAPLALAVLKGNVPLARLLTEKGVKVDARPHHGLTTLFWAVYRGDLDMVKLLVEKGAEVNKRIYRQLTPLHYAVYWDKGWPGIVRFLIENGAEVDAKCEEENTPLHYAAIYGFDECVKVLLEKGASLHAVNMYGSTPLHRAAFRGRKKTVRLLLSLHTAAGKGDLAAVAALLKKYPRMINSRDDEWKTPLHHAADNNQLKAAELLIANGADVNAKSRKKRVDLLHGVVGKLLVPRVGRVKYVKNEKKPLDLALQKGYTQMAQLLEGNGAIE